MSKPEPMPVDEESLRRALREKVEQLSGPKLRVFHRILQRLEVDQTVAELDEAFDVARVKGNLTAEKIERAIGLHRSRRPYRA
jgi:hypothetical protein